ncbi:MAG: acyltransferase [Candidatus Obscuribacterales bacterium]|jgi:peptidoglycan/LPS O-acetylase OafA/YrhL|nr:acyltransferase [Candidatus Obscuribacterales bacterium]
MSTAGTLLKRDEKHLQILATAKGQSPNSFSYIPALDGLRALAILLVMGFHQLGPATGWLGQKLNGWAGVDLFFIISGFLISSILMKERDREGTFNLRNFYVRRWLRICPAYYLFLALMFVFMLWRGQHDYSAFAIAGFYLSNIDMAAGWGLLPASSGLMHTWSLSVEEQFYLLWPATLLLVKDSALKVCLSIIATVYFWRLALVTLGVPWLGISVGLDTKLDSLMLGVLAALLWRMPSAQIAIKNFFSNPLMHWGSVASTIAALLFLGHPALAEPTIFWALKMPGTLLAMTALLLAILANPTSTLGKFLSWRPMVFVGQLSYSLYLWHVIVNFPETNAIFESLCNHRRYLVEFAKYAFCFAIASGSFYLVERPFLKLKSRFSS